MLYKLFSFSILRLMIPPPCVRLFKCNICPKEMRYFPRKHSLLDPRMQNRDASHFHELSRFERPTLISDLASVLCRLFPHPHLKIIENSWFIESKDHRMQQALRSEKGIGEQNTSTHGVMSEPGQYSGF